jgi:hypothetical protein
MPFPRLGVPVDKPVRQSAGHDLTNELPQAHFAELRLEGQRCNDVTRKAQWDGPFATSEVHRQREVCAVPLLAVDVVSRRRCSLIVLRALQENLVRR